MSIKTVVCCDKCDNVIKDSNSGTVNGLAVVGNIHVVDSKNAEGVGGGLVGNNITSIDNVNQDDPTKWNLGDEFVDEAVVKRVSYYCKSCFLAVVFGDEHVNRDNQVLDQLMGRETKQWPATRQTLTNSIVE